MAARPGHIEELKKSFPALDDFLAGKHLGGEFPPREPLGGYFLGTLPEVVIEVEGGWHGSVGHFGPGSGTGAPASGAGGDYFGEDGFWGDENAVPEWGDGGDSGNGDDANPGSEVIRPEHPALVHLDWRVELDVRNGEWMPYNDYRVKNNTADTIYYKSEGGVDAVPIPPGGTIPWDIEIDGLSIADVVYKFVDGYSYIEVNSTTITTHYDLDGSNWFQDAWGGVEGTPPDWTWIPLFQAQ